MDEKEIQERVKFKLNDIWNGIKNRISANKSLSYSFALEGNGIKSESHRGKKETFEELYEIFQKEIKMPVPYDRMYEEKQKKLRDKVVNEIMRKYDFMHKNIGREYHYKRQSFLEFIVKSIEESQNV